METKEYKTDGRRKVWNRGGSGAEGLSREIKHLCERDIRILSLLEKYPLLDSEHLFALAGGKQLNRFKERLRLLSDPPNNYIHWPPRQQYRANNHSKLAIWGRVRRGKDVLERRGLPVNDNPYSEYHDIFEHQYESYATLASIEIGGAKLTILHKEPFEVSISREHQGQHQHRTFKYVPDGIARIDFENGLHGYLQVEVEKENSVRRSNLDQPSFERKLLAIQHIMDKRLYQTKWGFPHLLTLIVSPYPEKLAEMKKVVLEQTNGQGLPYLLFSEIVGFDHPWKSFKPRPEFFTGTWERTGSYAPFSLVTPPKPRKGDST